MAIILLPKLASSETIADNSLNLKLNRQANVHFERFPNEVKDKICDLKCRPCYRR